MNVCIGIETVEGVEGTGIAKVLGVLFSSSVADIILVGVANGVMLLGFVFCEDSLCLLFRSSSMFAAFAAFEESVEDMGEKGLRSSIGDSPS